MTTATKIAQDFEMLCFEMMARPEPFFVNKFEAKLRELLFLCVLNKDARNPDWSALAEMIGAASASEAQGKFGAIQSLIDIAHAENALDESMAHNKKLATDPHFRQTGFYPIGTITQNCGLGYLEKASPVFKKIHLYENGTLRRPARIAARLMGGRAVTRTELYSLIVQEKYRLRSMLKPERSEFDFRHHLRGTPPRDAVI